MEAWDFPRAVLPGESVSVCVEWDEGILHKTSNDGAELTYSLAGTDSSFQIQARASDGFTIQVQLFNLPITRTWPTDLIPLGWKHNGYVAFILAGDVGNFTRWDDPGSWMQNNRDQLGPRTLRGLCMPGSHDSGMSVLESGTTFGWKCNTLAQTKSALDQLNAGVRYFDIRPVITSGNYATGHYGHILFNRTWQGSNGQSIESIIADLNLYTCMHEELVVLYLSHDLDTDQGNNSYLPFTQDNWDDLVEKLRTITGLYVVPNPTTIDLTQIPLNDYIGGNQPKVLVVIDPDGEKIDIARYADLGIYGTNNYTLFNKYSETNDLDTMATGQLKQLQDQRTSPDAPCFVLSWTLTQSATQAATCNVGADSILDLAAEANPAIFAQLLSACSAQTYPNVLYTDDVPNGIASLAMAVNLKAIETT